MAEQASPKRGRGRPRKDATITKAVDNGSVSLSYGNESIPPIKLGETGFSGLRALNGILFEECNSDLRWPRSSKTFKEMSKDATIAPALSMVEMAIARVPWTVKVPEGYEDELGDKAEFLRQVMNDMEHSWGSFIRQVVSFNRYGFSIHEKVYRRRYKKNGSKYDDGLVGIRKLPIRPQDTITAWDWANEGRDLNGCWQAVVKPSNKNSVSVDSSSDDVFIPRKKFMLFRNNPLKDTPQGESPLTSVYLAWKYKTELEKYEATAIATDVRGLKVLKLNPRYMDPNASDEDRAVFSYYQRIMNNLHNGEQSGVIIPSLKDEQGEEMIADLSLLSITGQKSYDVDKTIQRYKTEIITALMASQLILGQNGGGSFSLAESLNGISQMAVEARLIEIKDILNQDLVPQLFALNGWQTDVLPEITYGDLSTPDLDVLSKFIQRCASVGLVGQDAATVNWIASQANMPIPFEDASIDVEEARQMLTGYSSGAGEGMAKGSGNGTSDSASGTDNSTVNMEN